MPCVPYTLTPMSPMKPRMILQPPITNHHTKPPTFHLPPSHPFPPLIIFSFLNEAMQHQPQPQLRNSKTSDHLIKSTPAKPFTVESPFAKDVSATKIRLVDFGFLGCYQFHPNSSQFSNPIRVLPHMQSSRYNSIRDFSIHHTSLDT